MRVMFRRRQRERKLDVFFPPKKPKMFAGQWCGEHLGLFWRGKNIKFSLPLHAADET